MRTEDDIMFTKLYGRLILTRVGAICSFTEKEKAWLKDQNVETMKKLNNRHENSNILDLLFILGSVFGGLGLLALLVRSCS
jgi:hypothetical protein